MNLLSCNCAVVTILAAFVLPISAARAQYNGVTPQPAPLYPYAIQVAPNTYVIPGAAPARAYPYVRDYGARNPAPEKSAKRFDRPRRPVDHKLIEELRKRVQTNRTVVNTQQVVHDQPAVIETQRVVDDPPRTIERRHVVEDEQPGAHRKSAVIEDGEPDKRVSRDDNKKRVIEADAEITILGPDRMSIRLFRKGQGPKAKAHARAD